MIPVGSADSCNTGELLIAGGRQLTHHVWSNVCDTTRIDGEIDRVFHIEGVDEVTVEGLIILRGCLCGGHRPRAPADVLLCFIECKLHVITHSQVCQERFLQVSATFNKSGIFLAILISLLYHSETLR